MLLLLTARMELRDLVLRRPSHRHRLAHRAQVPPVLLPHPHQARARGNEESRCFGDGIEREYDNVSFQVLVARARL